MSSGGERSTGARQNMLPATCRHDTATALPLKRRPLAVGNVYRFRGYKGNGFKIVGMSLPGTESDDGGLPGVAVQWLNHSKQRGWYAFNSEYEFWSYLLFRNACDPEEA